MGSGAFSHECDETVALSEDDALDPDCVGDEQPAMVPTDATAPMRAAPFRKSRRAIPAWLISPMMFPFSLFLFYNVRSDGFDAAHISGSEAGGTSMEDGEISAIDIDG